MAITCSLTLHTYGGLAVSAAYIRVATAETYKALIQTNPDAAEGETPILEERQFTRYSADVFLDAAARASRANPVDRASGTFEWDPDTTPNVLTACYADLKAQDTYAAATDC